MLFENLIKKVPTSTKVDTSNILSKSSFYFILLNYVLKLKILFYILKKV